MHIHSLWKDKKIPDCQKAPWYKGIANWSLISSLLAGGITLTLNSFFNTLVELKKQFLYKAQSLKLSLDVVIGPSQDTFYLNIEQAASVLASKMQQAACNYAGLLP